METSAGEIIEAAQWSVDQNTHIFLKEVSAAVNAILAAHAHGKIPRVFVDNMPAHLALQRRLSTNFLANTMIAKVAHLPYATVCGFGRKPRRQIHEGCVSLDGVPSGPCPLGPEGPDPDYVAKQAIFDW